MRGHHGYVLAWVLVVALAGCSPTTPSGSETTASVEPSVAPASASPSDRRRLSRPRCSPASATSPSRMSWRLSSKRCSTRSANGDGLTATVISPQGTWSGATGFAAGDRQMVPNDQMSIAHITQTVVAAQVMQLVEAGELNLDDLAADRLPPGLGFDTNGATHRRSPQSPQRVPRYAARPRASGRASRPTHCTTGRSKRCLRPSDPSARRPVRNGSSWEPTTCCSA